MNIREIAKAAKVSPATVSRVFNHAPGVSAAVAERVLQIAAEYNYHPRLPEKQRNIVVITPYNSIFPSQSCIDMLLRALAQELPGAGFRMEILPLNSMDRLSEISFCGAVAIGIDPCELADWDSRFGAPVIFLDRHPAPDKRTGYNTYFVNSDEQMGMELALDFLAERGCRKIGCIIHGEPDAGNTRLRYKAIQDWLSKNNFPQDERLVLFSGNGNEKYVEQTGKLLKLGADALFCPGGSAGITVLYALSLYGKTVPDDISLIASEQSFFSSYAVPPQTTITQEYSQVARKATEIFIRRLNGEKVPVISTLPYRLIKRESVK